eukprot:g33523.t1
MGKEQQQDNGECIHMDFRGPWPVRSLEGNRRQWRSSWCKPIQRRWKWRSGRFDSSHRYLSAITKKVEEHRNVRFNHSVRGYTASVNPQLWDEDAEKGNQLEQTDTVSPLQKTKQISREDRNIWPQVSAEKAEEAEGESTIVVVDDDSLPAQRVAGRQPPPPALERAEIEVTPLVRAHGVSRPESLRSARRIRFEEKAEVKGRPAKNKAPRDIEGNIEHLVILRGTLMKAISCEEKE